jgi:VCBS repeat-containing protein
VASIATRVGRRIGVAPAAGARPVATARLPLQAPFQRRLVFEELEARLLLSADLNPLATDALLAAPAANGAEFRAIAAPSESVVISAGPAAIRRSVEIAFVDAGAPDHERLVAAMRETALAEGRELEVVLIGLDDDGLRTITETLAARSGLDAVHIVSHGEAGAVQLGRARLDFVALAAHATQIKSWGQALDADADLLIYGCNVAATAEGRSLVDALARLTGADVAASEDPTGSAALGGNWTLEYRSGEIEAAALTGESGWRGLLAETVWMGHAPPFSELDDTGYELKSDQAWGERFRLTGGGPSTTYDVNRIDVVLSRSSDAPVQTITVSLRESWNGPALATASISSASLTTTEQWYEFRFGAALALNKNQEYFIRVDTSGLEKVYLGVDPSNSGGNDVLINQSGAPESGKDAAYRVVFDTAAAPVATDDLYAMNEDATLTVAAAGGVLANDADADTPAASLSALLVAGPSNGTLALGADGAFVYTPRADFYGSDSFSYRVSDGALTSNVATVTIAVNNVADHVLVVDTVADSVDGDVSSIDALLANKGADGFVSLREAILAANNSPNGVGPDLIRFAIAGAGPHVINVLSPLPTITDAVIIDATSEPDFAGMPVVVLDGGGGAGSGLHITAGGSTIRGLAIGGFGEHGIWLAGGGGNLIAGNLIGTDPSGSLARGNNFNGVFVEGSANNVIGGTAPAERNVISGNGRYGVLVSGAGAAGNAIRGNYVGLNAAGSAALANIGAGIAVQGGATGTSIGGLTSGAGNVVSGNRSNGVEISGAGTSSTVVQGNRIGTDFTGNAAIGNGLNGISVSDGATSTSIGGAASGARNVVSGNAQSGIRVSGANTTGVVISGNYLGLNAAGNAAVGNGWYGVQLGATGTVLGGLTASERNVISGNLIDGVYVSGGSGNAIRGNYIGTDAAGNVAIGNREDGVWIDGGTNTVVGGTAAGAGNVISGNAWSGVATSGAGAGTVIAGNVIGLNAAGTGALGNLRHGVQLAASSGATVGGTAPEAANIIAHNGLAGVATSGSAAHRVLGNSIHDNGGLGIDLGTDGVTLGGQPQLLWALSDGSVAGTLASTANTTFRIELFASATADPSGYGEGRRYLGFVTVTTDAAGNAAFVATVAAMASGDFVTATATGAATGATSEFSANVVAIKPNAAPAGADAAVAAVEDVPYVFGLADFPFSDADAGDVLGAVRIDMLPAAGTLRLSGVDVAAGQIVAAADLAAGRLAFLAAADAYGAPYTVFTFTVRDSGTPPAFAAAPSTMTVNVAPVNDAPSGTSGTIGTSMSIARVLAAADFGFTDPDPGDVLGSVRVESLPAVGALTLGLIPVLPGTVVSAAQLNAGDLVFTPLPLTFGSPYASFDFQVADASGTFAASANTLTINVALVNSAPSGTSTSVTLDEDTTRTLYAVDFGFVDADAGDSLSAVRIDALPTAGAFTLSGAPVIAGQIVLAADLAGGQLVFAPGVDEFGAPYASVAFSVRDSFGAFDASPKSLTFAVLPINDAPVITSASAITVDENTTLVQTVTASDVDSPSAAFTFSIAGGADAAAFVIDATTGVLSFAVAPDFESPADADGDNVYEVTVQVSDGDGGSATQALAVTVADANEAPVAAGEGYATDEDAPLFIAGAGGVLANDSDADGDALNAVLVTGPAFGTLALNADGGFLYTPNADFFGTDSFTYRASDGALDSAPATVTITVGAVNDAPVRVAGAAGDVVVAEDSGTTSLGLGALAYSAGPANESGQSLTYTVTTVPPAALGEVLLADGTTVVNAGSTYTLAALQGMQFRAAADAHGGPAAFGWTVRDDGGTANAGTDLLAESLTITVTPANDAPVAVADAYTIDEDTPLVIAAADLLANDTDLDGDALSVTSVQGAVGGSVSLVAGTITFTPTAHSFGPAAFTYTVSDGNGGSATGTVSITVNPVNDGAVAGADAYTVAEDGTLTVAALTGVLANDTDVDGDPLTAVLDTGPSNGTLTLNPDGSFTYTPNANFNGTDSFTYRANDGALSSALATVLITVTGVNDAPTSAAGSVGTTAPSAYTFTLADFPFADIDGDPLERIRVTALPAVGVLTLDGAAVAAGDEILASAIAAGRLRYAPPADLATAMVVQFGFLVSDGAAFAAASEMMTIGVAPLAAVGTPSASPGDPDDAPPEPPVDDGGGMLSPPQAGDGGFGPFAPAAEGQPDTASKSPASALAGGGERPTSGGGRGGAGAGGDGGAASGFAAGDGAGAGEGAAPAAPVLPTVAAAGLSSSGASAAALLGGREGGLGGIGVADGSGHELDTGAEARAIEAIAAPEFLRRLDLLREEQQVEAAIEMRVAGSVLVVSSGLSVGYVLWLLRGGVLLSSLLTSLPAWRLVDPLPVLGRMGDQADEEDDDSLEDMVEANDDEPAADPVTRRRTAS